MWSSSATGLGHPMASVYEGNPTPDWLRGGSVEHSQDFQSLLEGMLTFPLSGYHMPLCYHVLWQRIQHTQRQAEGKAQQKKSQKSDPTTPEGQDSILGGGGEGILGNPILPKRLLFVFLQ